MNQTQKLLLATLGSLLLIVVMTACRLLHLGGTNADGTPKTGIQAADYVRSVGDAGLRKWGTELLKEKVPQAVAFFDANADGVITLAEFESKVNLEDPEQVTLLLLMGVELYSSRPK